MSLSEISMDTMEELEASRVKNVFALTLMGVFATAVLCIAVRANVSGSLPEVFLSVLTEIKAKTTVPLLLPAELPRPFNDAKYAIVDKAAADEYAIIHYYELGVGNAGFAASFGARNNAPYSPRELANVQTVKLAGGIVGFFRPVSCGGSCPPEPVVETRVGAL
jgi:hypothetical protein